MKVVDIVFEGKGPDLTFVEVETPDGRSVRVGEWITDTPNRPRLRLRLADQRVSPAS